MRARLLALPLLLAGCINVEGYSRGEVVPVDQLQARKDQLPALVEEKLAADEGEAAFYCLEIQRTRRMGAQRIAQGGKKVAPIYKDKALHQYLVLNQREERPDPRGGPMGKLSPAEQEQLAGMRRELIAAGRTDDEAFWKELRVTERRLQAYGESYDPFERPYHSVYRDASVVVSVQDVRLGLAPEEALIEWFLGPNGVKAFVVRHTGLTVHPLEPGAEQLAQDVEAFRLLVSRGRPGWEVPARRLFEQVLGPVLPALEGATTLFLVAPGGLSNLPFQALIDQEGKVALERWRLVYEPSFSFYKSVLGRPPAKEPLKVLALGHHTLRMAMKEAAKVGVLFPGSEAWLPREGAHWPHEQMFYRRLKEFNAFHFATHGQLVPATPLASNLSLYGDPEFDDGELTAAEIRTLDLAHAQVVFLSACMSAQSGQAEDGDLASLAAAFMTAGAPTVVGSLWPVNDLSTGAIALRFYERLLELGPGESLRQAQLEVRQGKVLERHKHPQFWAAFNLYGMDR